MGRKGGCAVLIVDDDPLVLTVMAEYLSKTGMTTAVASSGQQALEQFSDMNPDVIVADLRMPVMDGLDLLESVKKSGSSVPVIIMTGSPDTSSAIRALQNGAYDYVLKPVHLPTLAEKIRKAFYARNQHHENSALAEIVSLSTITGKLAAANDVDALLDIIFRYGLELTGAPSGAIILQGDHAEELVYARQQGFGVLCSESREAEEARHSIARWAFSSGKPLTISRGAMQLPAFDTPPRLHAACGEVHALMAVPLAISRETMGVFLVERQAPLPSFSQLDFNRMEVLSSQAGIAITNANLCTSLNQKLEELKLVSTFSEQIMGKTDKYDLIRSLFEKVQEQCAVDVIGFLLVQQRRPEFLYWTRGPLDEEDLCSIRRSVVDFFNEKASHAITENSVSTQLLLGQKNDALRVSLPMPFKHIVPILWQENELGAFLVGASAKRPENFGSEALIAGLVNQIRIALVNAKLYNDMKENYIRTIKALAIAVDAKDTYTSGHSENVMLLAEELAREMKECDAGRVAIIRDAALLHDIGKIGIPAEILNKPGALTYDEFNGVMKSHSTLGANIVKNVPFLADLYKLILYHHEHFDGSGYPEGLKGEDIPLGARILHVADAFDAMTSDRPYRSNLGNQEAIRRLIADSGKHFDPAVVNIFLAIARRKGMLK